MADLENLSALGPKPSLDFDRNPNLPHEEFGFKDLPAKELETLRYKLEVELQIRTRPLEILMCWANLQPGKRSVSTKEQYCKIRDNVKWCCTIYIQDKHQKERFFCIEVGSNDAWKEVKNAAIKKTATECIRESSLFDIEEITTFQQHNTITKYVTPPPKRARVFSRGCDDEPPKKKRATWVQREEYHEKYASPTFQKEKLPENEEPERSKVLTAEEVKVDLTSSVGDGLEEVFSKMDIC